MTSLVRWDPFRELEDFQNRLSGFFSRSPTQHVGKGTKGDLMRTAEWEPAVDIAEDDKEYRVKAELPEVPKENVHVTVENGVLLISGERKMEKEEKNKKFHRVERAYGTFLRSFSLPEDTDATKVKADFKDGVLQIHLPKSENAKPRQIEVQVT